MTWGHVISCEILNADDQLLNRVYFVCQPKFDKFESYQSKTTDELIAIAIKYLSSDTFESSLVKLRESGIRLMQRFNNLDEIWSPKNYK